MASYDDDIINQALRAARGAGSPADPWAAANARDSAKGLSDKGQGYQSFYDAAGVPDTTTADILNRLEGEKLNEWRGQSLAQRVNSGVYSDDPAAYEESQGNPIFNAMGHVGEKISNYAGGQMQRAQEADARLSPITNYNEMVLNRAQKIASLATGMFGGGLESLSRWFNLKPDVSKGDILAPPGTGLPTALGTAAVAKAAPHLLHDPHLAGTGHSLGANPHLNPEHSNGNTWTPDQWQMRHGFNDEPQFNNLNVDPQIARAKEIARQWQHSSPDRYTGFYSALTRSVEGAQMKAGTAQQWLNHFKKGGKDMPAVKDEELYWTGMNDWLKEQGNRKISRDELLNLAKEREVKPAVRENTTSGEDPAQFDEYQRESEAENARERVREQFTAENNGDGSFTLYRNGEPIKDGNEVESFSSKRDAMDRARDIIERETEDYLDNNSVYQRMKDYGSDISQQTRNYFDEIIERAGLDPDSYYEQVHGVRPKDLDRRGSKGMDRTDELGDDPHPYTTLPHTTGWTLAAKGKDARTQGDVRRIIELQGNWPQAAQEKGFKGSVTPEEIAALEKARAETEALRIQTAREYINLGEDGAFQFKPHVSSEDRGRIGNAMRDFQYKMEQNVRERTRLADNIADNEQRLATNENYVRRFTEKGDLAEAQSAQSDVDYLRKRIADKQAELAHLDDVIASQRQNFDELYMPHVTRVPRDLTDAIRLLNEDVTTFRNAAQHPSRTNPEERQSLLDEADKAEQKLRALIAERDARTPEDAALIQAYDDWTRRHQDARLRAREADDKLRTVQSGIEPGPWVGSHGDDKGWMNTQLKHTLYQAAKEGDEFVSVNPTEAAEHWGKEGNKDFYGRTIPESMVKLAKQHGFKGGLEDVYLGEPPKPPRASYEVGNPNDRNGPAMPQGTLADSLPGGGWSRNWPMDRAPFDIEGSRPATRVVQTIQDSRGRILGPYDRKDPKDIAAGTPVWVIQNDSGDMFGGGAYGRPRQPHAFRTREAAEQAMNDYNRELLRVRAEQKGFDPDSFDGTKDIGIRLTPEVRKSIIDKGFTTFAKSDVQDAALRAALEAAGVDPVEAALQAARDRASALGHLPDTFYHGTTHKIPNRTGFADPTNTSGPYHGESHHGRAIYMSSDMMDSQGNYAGAGPDLTQRISIEAERLEHDIADLSAAQRAALERYAKKIEKSGDLPDNADYYLGREKDLRLAYALAHKRLYGGEPQLMKLRTNPRNPVHVDDTKYGRGTRFEYEQPGYHVEKQDDGYVVKDGEGRILERYDDEGSAWDAADEMRYSEMPKGSAAKLMEFFNRHEFSDRMNGLKADLQEHIENHDGISARDFEKIVRAHEDTMNLLDYELPVGQLIQDAYRYLGHDAAIMPNAKAQFKGMGIAPDTTHIALFDNRRVRRTDAKFDPKKVDSTNLLASDALQSAEARAALHAGDPAEEALRVAKDVATRGYHGTQSGMPRFADHGNYELGPHFGSVDQANSRLDYTTRGKDNLQDGQAIVPVDMQFKNPLDIRDPGMFDAHNLPSALEATGKFSKRDIDALKRHEERLYDLEDDADYAAATAEFSDAVRDLLRREGYDALRYRNTAEHPEINAIMEKIRSEPRDSGRLSDLFAEKDRIEKRLAETGDYSYVPVNRGSVKSSITGNTLYADNADQGARSALRAGEDKGNVVRFPAQAKDRADRPTSGRDLEAPLMDALSNPKASKYDVLDAAGPVMDHLRDAYGFSVLRKGLAKDAGVLGNDLLNLSRAMRIVRETPEFMRHWTGQDSGSMREVAYRPTTPRYVEFNAPAGFGVKSSSDGVQILRVPEGAQPQQIADFIVKNQLFSDGTETAAMRAGMRGGERDAKSASYADKDGWKVHVVADDSLAQTPEMMRRAEQGKAVPQGRIIIEGPNGESVEGGRWMNMPEPGWIWNGVDLEKDYWAAPVGQSVWERQVPLEWKLQKEAEQQGAAYKPLAEQYRERMVGTRGEQRVHESWQPLVDAYAKGGDEGLAKAIRQHVPDIDSAVKLWESTPELGQLAWDGRPLVQQIADAAKHMARSGDKGIEDAVLLADNAKSAGARASLRQDQRRDD